MVILIEMIKGRLNNRSRLTFQLFDRNQKGSTEVELKNRWFKLYKVFLPFFRDYF